MPRKVILVVDPNVDGAVALCLALFDSRLDVVAVAAAAGSVSAEQATRNVQTIIEQLDPPRWPRIGAALQPEQDWPLDPQGLWGEDGLGGAGFPVSAIHNRHQADKVIAEEARGAELVDLVNLAPLTTLAATLVREPNLPDRLGQTILRGGSVRSTGDVSPAAEYNMYCDPDSARAVFRSSLATTLIPLDVTAQVTFTFDLLDQLPDETSSAGRFLRRVLPYAFRAYRERLGVEGILLHNAVGLAALLQPELFHLDEMAADVETVGRLTRGTTVFDLRPHREWRINTEAATAVDSAQVREAIIRGLQAAGEAG